MRLLSQLDGGGRRHHETLSPASSERDGSRRGAQPNLLGEQCRLD